MTSESSVQLAAIKARLKSLAQDSPYSSPWSPKTLIRMAMWQLTWLLLCRWTPKPLFRWRSWVLRAFGASTSGTVFVASSASIKMPWNLVLHDRACIGSKAEIYNMARVTVGARATIAQEVYVCTGTHDFDDPKLPLVVGPIDIGSDAFVGARAFLSPGIAIGEGAVIGACSVVTRSAPSWSISAGNPCRFVRARRALTYSEPTDMTDRLKASLRQ